MNDIPYKNPQSHEEQIHITFKAKLQALDCTSRHTAKTFSLKGFVLEHYEDLASAHRKGHTWSALAAFIQSELGKEIAPETLRKYMAAIRKEVEASNITADTHQPQSIQHPSAPKYREERSFPLAKNLQPSVDREFRSSHRRNNP